MKEITITSVVKEGGKDVRILILLSTGNLDDKIQRELEQSIKEYKGILVGNQCHIVDDYHQLSETVSKYKGQFDILCFFAHGDNDHRIFFSNDKYFDKSDMSFDEAEVALVLGDVLDDKIGIFASCYIGTENMFDCLTNYPSMALCAICVKPNVRIPYTDAVQFVTKFVEKMQELKHLNINTSHIKEIVFPYANSAVKEQFELKCAV